MAGIGIVNSTQNNINVSQSRIEAQQITGNSKSTRVAGQSQDDLVELATSQTQQTEGDEQYSHQRYVALQGYINYGKDEGEQQPANIGGGKGAASEAADEAFEKMFKSAQPASADQTGGEDKTSAQAITGSGKGAAVESDAEVRKQMTLPGNTSTDADKVGGGEKTSSQALTGSGKGAAAEAEEEKSKAVDEKGRPVDNSKSSTQQQKGANGKELTEEELQEIQDMQARHEEVQVHEQAHKSAGGQYAGAPSYSYETGPDGKRYITDGEVSIDIGEEDNPQATIEKMQIVKRAAMAPAEPSAQDRKVYQEATQKEARARQELAQENKEKSEERLESAKSAMRGENTTAADKTKEAKEARNGEKIEPAEVKPPKSSDISRSLESVIVG